MIPREAFVVPGWEAELALEYEFREGRTVLARRRHRGPLRVQRDLYPEGAGTCHTIVVHPPGGIAGGDRLAVSVSLGESSAALLTTPGAAKWYRSLGAPARQVLEFRLDPGASLEWLPQEAIVFDGAQAEMATTVRLAGAAVYVGWEIICFGRRESGESFTRGGLRQRTEIFADGERLWNEFAGIRGGDPMLRSPLGLGGRSVCATLIAAGGDLGLEVLAECRRMPMPDNASVGITRMPRLLVARMLCDDSEQAKHYFSAIWRVLRPVLLDRPAQMPRIWAT